jgi:hypothetical protein
MTQMNLCIAFNVILVARVRRSTLLQSLARGNVQVADPNVGLLDVPSPLGVF